MSGYKPGSAQFGSIGAVFGEKSHTQTVAEMPSHTHIQNNHQHDLWAGTHSGQAYYETRIAFNRGYPANGVGTRAQIININEDRNIPYGQAYAYPVAATNQNTGDGQAFNVIQPTRAVLVVIKT